ncbi:unnamed protein product [Protopolystoma xenopodis]|uniref:Uncharacterized protein n=1 Tax=Protopolystoma xenopodis TaxID=117903 RepID=A0A448WT38_9PLAT|nr:unnamed protein product [Protopolystoma xenopodis]
MRSNVDGDEKEDIWLMGLRPKEMKMPRSAHYRLKILEYDVNGDWTRKLIGRQAVILMMMMMVMMMMLLKSDVEGDLNESQKPFKWHLELVVTHS